MTFELTESFVQAVRDAAEKLTGEEVLEVENARGYFVTFGTVPPDAVEITTVAVGDRSVRVFTFA